MFNSWGDQYQRKLIILKNEEDEEQKALRGFEY